MRSIHVSLVVLLITIGCGTGSGVDVLNGFWTIDGGSSLALYDTANGSLGWTPGNLILTQAAAKLVGSCADYGSMNARVILADGGVPSGTVGGSTGALVFTWTPSQWIVSAVTNGFVLRHPTYADAGVIPSATLNGSSSGETLELTGEVSYTPASAGLPPVTEPIGGNYQRDVACPY